MNEQVEVNHAGHGYYNLHFYDADLVGYIITGDTESTMRSVHNLLTQAGASQMSYQNFVMTEREDGYFVTDKMTGEILMASNKHYDVSVNKIPPEVADVLRNGCNGCINEVRTVNAELDGLLAQIDMSDRSDEFAGLANDLDTLNTQLDGLQKRMEVSGLSEVFTGLTDKLRTLHTELDGIYEQIGRSDGSEAFAVGIENPGFPLPDFERTDLDIEDDFEL